MGLSFEKFGIGIEFWEIYNWDWDWIRKKSETEIDLWKFLDWGWDQFSKFWDWNWQPSWDRFFEILGLVLEPNFHNFGIGIEIWKILGLGMRLIFYTRDLNTFGDPWLQLNVWIFSVPIGYSAERSDLKRLNFRGAVESAKSSRLAGLKWPLGRFDWKRIFGDIKRKSCMNTVVRGQQIVRFYPVQLISYRYWYRNVYQVKKLRIPVPKSVDVIFFWYQNTTPSILILNFFNTKFF